MCIRLIYAVIPSLTTTPTDERVRRHGKSESPIYQGCFPSFPFSRYFFALFLLFAEMVSSEKRSTNERSMSLHSLTRREKEKKRKVPFLVLSALTRKEAELLHSNKAGNCILRQCLSPSNEDIYGLGVLVVFTTARQLCGPQQRV